MSRGVPGLLFRRIRDRAGSARRCYAVIRLFDDTTIGVVWTHDLDRWLAGALPTFAAHEAAFGRGRPAFGSRREAAEALAVAMRIEGAAA